MDWHWSPLMIPLGAFVVAIVAIVSGIVSEMHRQRLRAEQRMAMVARGMSSDEIERVLGRPSEDMKPTSDHMNSLGKSRRAAVSLISTGVGLSVFGLLLAWIVQEHEVLVVAAAGLIPLAIGIGFIVDYYMQKRELAHFGIELGPRS
jgi:hypothetical protein